MPWHNAVHSPYSVTVPTLIQEICFQADESRNADAIMHLTGFNVICINVIWWRWNSHVACPKVLLLHFPFHFSSCWCRIWGVCKQSRWRHSVTVPSRHKMADMRYYGNVMTTTRWWLCVTMETLWQQQDGDYALLWQRYDNNKMVAMRYYGNVMIFYIFNSTVIDWTCFFFLKTKSIYSQWHFAVIIRACLFYFLIFDPINQIGDLKITYSIAAPSTNTDTCLWVVAPGARGLLFGPVATAQHHDIPVKSQLEGKIRRATSQLRTSPYRVRLYKDRALKPDDCDDTTTGSTFLETTDIQKEFYFTHDSGRVKNAKRGESGKGGSCQ